jgi:hypothetical protein
MKYRWFWATLLVVAVAPALAQVPARNGTHIYDRFRKGYIYLGDGTHIYDRLAPLAVQNGDGTHIYDSLPPPMPYGVAQNLMPAFLAMPGFVPPEWYAVMFHTEPIGGLPATLIMGGMQMP